MVHRRVSRTLNICPWSKTCTCSRLWARINTASRAFPMGTERTEQEQCLHHTAVQRG